MLHSLEEFASWLYGGEDPHRLSRQTHQLMGLVRQQNLEREYHPAFLPKAEGGKRQLWVPSRPLAHLQRGVLQLLGEGSVSSSATAYEPGCSLRKNALPHCGTAWLVRLDLEGFFHSISFRQVYRAIDQALERSPLVGKHYLNEFDRPCRSDGTYNQVLSFYFAHFCTWRGCLPQGAPTSPHLSNLVFYPLDEALLGYCKRNGITYTRYSDDLFFSALQLSVGDLLRFVRPLLSAHGFRLNEQKTQIVGPGGRKQLAGVVVSNKLQARRELRRQLRQVFYYIGRFGLDSHLERVGEQQAPDAYLRQLIGRVGFVLQINPADQEFQHYMERGKVWLRELEQGKDGRD